MQWEEHVKRPDGPGIERVRVVVDEPTPLVPRMSRVRPWYDTGAPAPARAAPAETREQPARDDLVTVTPAK